MNQKTEELVDALNSSERTCFLTGAGISTLSGIPDFKSTDAQWKYDVPRSELISRKFFEKNPELFWKVYRELFHMKVDAIPNVVHEWIAGFEEGRTWVEVVTQNVDGLHDKAGSTVVHAVHGDISSTVCINKSCRRRFTESFAAISGVPECGQCGGILKPNVVLFGEQPKGTFQAEQAVLTSDLLVVMGTSLEVAPVSIFPVANKILRPGTVQMWVGATPPPMGYKFDHQFIGDFRDFLEIVGKNR